MRIKGTIHIVRETSKGVTKTTIYNDESKVLYQTYQQEGMEVLDPIAILEAALNADKIIIKKNRKKRKRFQLFDMVQEM